MEGMVTSLAFHQLILMWSFLTKRPCNDNNNRLIGSKCCISNWNKLQHSSYERLLYFFGLFKIFFLLDMYFLLIITWKSAVNQYTILHKNQVKEIHWNYNWKYILGYTALINVF
jgi:hypothetical protein